MSVVGGWLLLQLSVVAAFAVHRLLGRLSLPAATRVRSGRLGVVVALLAPLLVGLLPASEPPFRAPAQVWSSADQRRAVVEIAAPAGWVHAPAARVEVPTPSGLDAVALGLLALVSLGVVGWQLLAVRRLLAHSARVHRLGRIEVRVGAAPTPFALWLPSRRVVMLDPDTWSDLRDRLPALRHELQHHRAGDPEFAWVLALCRALCLPNPFAHWLAHDLGELDELACDHALVSRHQRSRDAYAQTLLRVAKRALPTPAPAVGFNHPTLLQRRLFMLTRPRSFTPRSIALTLGLPALFVAAVALAGDSLTVDHRVPQARLHTVLERLDAAGFSVADQPLVRQHIRRLTATKDGRDFSRRALHNRRVYAELVDGALRDWGLPAQLAAIPFVESGYQNLDTSANPVVNTAGLWQFIPRTARQYGLQVGPLRDQRRDVALATEAACQLLSDLHDDFGDWGLAIAAYNAGPSRVHQVMQDEGTDSVYVLMEAGLLNDYAAMVFAGAVVLEDPEAMLR